MHATVRTFGRPGELKGSPTKKGRNNRVAFCAMSKGIICLVPRVLPPGYLRILLPFETSFNSCSFLFDFAEAHQHVVSGLPTLEK